MSIKHLLKEMKLPQEIQLISENENGTSEDNSKIDTVIVEPFERGFAITIGNLLRRILLSSIQGYAITAFRIAYNNKFLTSEYESIPGIIEDSIDIVENLKSLKFIIDQEAEPTRHTLNLEFKGTGKCLASNLERPGIEILNKDKVLFEASDPVDLFIELELELGRGYIPSEITEKRIEEAGTISIDAVFSPIENVKFNVEGIRIGHRSDYEKLLITVETDGTITPRNAIAKAAKIAKEHMSLFINFNEDNVEIRGEDETKLLEMKKLLALSIDELELSSRSYNCLRAANILNIGALVRLTEREIQGLPNFGNKSMEEIQTKLAEMNFTLGMKLPPEVLEE